MSYNVKDRIYLQLLINDVEVPLNDNMLDSVHVVESVRLAYPALTLKIKDLTKFLTRNNLLLDGSSITLVHQIENVRNTYYFRLFSHSEEISGGYTTYTVRGYLDVPKYLSQSLVEPYKGSTSSLLQYVCGVVGLSYNGLVTADNQTWYPFNQRLCDYARSVSERAWVSQSSCCQMVVTSNKEMILKDVSQFASQDPTQLFSNKDNSNTQTVITDFQAINKSGFFNSQTGYKETRVLQSILKPDSSLNSLDVRRNTTRMMMNKDIREEVSQSKVVFAPIDVGNVSDTHENAIYQNRRISNTFSFGLEFVTPRPVTANVLDTVNCEIAKPGLDGVDQYSGKFLLATKVLYIQGINSYYKCEVYRQGLNSKDQSQV